MDENEAIAKLIEQHFVLEAKLVAGIGELNDASSVVLQKGGFQGPTQEECEQLKPLSAQVQQMAQKLKQARASLLNRINRSSEQPCSSLKDYIRTLGADSREHLNQLRTKVLDESSRNQATLLQNQAVLFYTRDFHRKYLYGVMQSDDKQSGYGSDGQAKNAVPSNVIGRSC